MDECLLFKAFERCDYIPEEQMREIKWEIILVVNYNNGWMFVIQSLWKVWLYSRGTNERNKVGNYIGGQLISWSPNNCYYEEQYNFATKLHIVDGSEKMGFQL